jgi:hypothetical protein
LPRVWCDFNAAHSVVHLPDDPLLNRAQGFWGCKFFCAAKLSHCGCREIVKLRACWCQPSFCTH